MVVAVLLFAFFVARSCQQDQIRITEEQAIATAEEQIEFTPEETQIRLLRQGIDTRPFWIVSLSIPKGEREDRFSRLALVHIDANTGKVTKVEEQEPARTRQTEKR
ncbi:MAG: PepSY domain-containing protein [Actinomycetota bacterium]